MEEAKRLLIDIKMLNMLPVNERARELLDKAGAESDTESLYCVQLAKWGYEKGGIEVEEAVLETIYAMLTWKPERITNFLLINIEKMEYNPQGWQEASEPLDLARIIKEDIEEKVRMHFPWYGCAE